MNRAGAIFSTIAALLEDMHAVAVEGQGLGLSSDEGLSLLSILRADARKLERKIADADASLAL